VINKLTNDKKYTYRHPLRPKFTAPPPSENINNKIKRISNLEKKPKKSLIPVVWNFNKPMGGLTTEQVRNAKMILWGGYCSVHQFFQPEQIDAFLERYPETKVIAHPEACFEVCQKADYIGSTEYILKTVREAEPNTRWLVATELNLVNRFPQKT
jgi:quinolinate synthase